MSFLDVYVFSLAIIYSSSHHLIFIDWLIDWLIDQFIYFIYLFSYVFIIYLFICQQYFHIKYKMSLKRDSDRKEVSIEFEMIE